MQTAVVTGASRGIGKAVAEKLVESGFRVLMLGRDGATGEAIRAELAKRGHAEWITADLGSVAGIEAAAAAVARAAPRLDLLIQNAGIWPQRRVLSADGFEESFVVNHLAPFLLNHRLASALAPGARIVQVSSGLYAKGTVDLERTPSGLDFHPIRTYASTKLCNLLLLRAFARLFEPAGVTVNALHPGVIRTGLGDRAGVFGLLLKAVKRTWKSPETGARSVLRLACDPALQGVTGKYFHVERETELEPVARDEELAARVWAHAAAAVGLGERDGYPAPR